MKLIIFIDLLEDFQTKFRNLTLREKSLVTLISKNEKMINEKLVIK